MDRRIGIAAVLAVAVIIGASACYVIYNGSERPSIEAVLSEEEHARGLVISVTAEDLESIGASYGSDLEISCGGKKVVALYTQHGKGAGTYSPVVNHSESTGKVTISVGSASLEDLGLAAGDIVRISCVGPDPLYGLMPHYIAGYTSVRADYDSDQQFGNYREVRGGDMKEGLLYRTSSPFNLRSERTAYSDAFLRENGITSLITMDMNPEDVEKSCESLPSDAYAPTIFEAGNVYASVLRVSFFSHPEEMRFVLQSFLDAEGSIAIHCTFGKDRTGFYCAVLEALAGASYEDVRADFMLSMCNYYHFEPGTEEYDAVAASYVDRILYILGHPEFKDHPALVDWRNVSYEPYDMESKVTEYLVGVIGMEQELVDAVKAKLTARTSGCRVARH